VYVNVCVFIQCDAGFVSDFDDDGLDKLLADGWYRLQ